MECVYAPTNLLYPMMMIISNVGRQLRTVPLAVCVFLGIE